MTHITPPEDLIRASSLNILGPSHALCGEPISSRCLKNPFSLVFPFPLLSSSSRVCPHQIPQQPVARTLHTQGHTLLRESDSRPAGIRVSVCGKRVCKYPRSTLLALHFTVFASR